MSPQMQHWNLRFKKDRAVLHCWHWLDLLAGGVLGHLDKILLWSTTGSQKAASNAPDRSISPNSVPPPQPTLISSW